MRTSSPRTARATAALDGIALKRALAYFLLCAAPLVPLKALAFAQFLRAPCLTDDSGLVIPALGGEPGVRSARYAGEQGDDEANLRLVLERIAERGLVEPEAYFQCHICVAVAGAPGEIVAEAEGRVYGRIVAEPRGGSRD